MIIVKNLKIKMQNDNEKLKIIRYLGVDWGEARIGLALADSETKIATPFKTAGNVDEVALVVKSERINMVVVGKPYQISNIQYPISNKFAGFLADLKNKIDAPIELVDERLSSKAADALAGTKKTKAGRDEIAAMLILQGYLDKLSS